MPPVDALNQYPSVQTMRHVDGVHHEPAHEREPAFYRQHNATQDGPLSPVNVKDFQDQHRSPLRRPSTPNFDRTSPRLRSGPAPPVPNAQHPLRQHPARDG